MHDFLKEILEHKKEVVAKKQKGFASLKKNISRTGHSRYKIFKQKISQPGQINLIAEIKKASPSKGLIRQDFEALPLADIYKKSGAAALSILTEEKYFLGNPRYVRDVSSCIDLPVLAKDFFIDEIQIYEAFNFGASAILLIMAILDDAKVKEFIQLASGLDLDCLVEVHNERELERALDCGAEIIGINNRDLNTFEVDLNVSEGLIPKIPEDKIIVVESGISSHEQVERFRELGAHAVLIGETFMREQDIKAKVKEIMGIEN